MAVKIKKTKTTWQALLPKCFKIDGQIQPNKKKVAAKEASFTRISYSDYSNSTLSEDISNSLAGSNINVFSLQELKVITQSFSSGNILGEGGFGPVYKGFVDDKLRPYLRAQPVAVKLLDLEGLQGHREWLVCSFSNYKYTLNYFYYLPFYFFGIRVLI